MEIYIHLPFCKSKCAYCDFNSLSGQEEGTVFSYLSALNREILLAGDAYGKAEISTVYIGGGTPSLLDSGRIKSILKVLGEHFRIRDDAEISIECNPESITSEKLADYKEAGINRMSIGVQSLDDANLKSIGRLHDRNIAISKIKLARQYFDNASCDIIVGLPYDTNDTVKEEIETLAPLVNHMSVYALTLEEGTPLALRAEEGKILLPSDDETEDYLELAEEILEKHGLIKYEVSNFASDGMECRHNLGYWTDEEYLGLGAGAHSYIKTSDGKNPLPTPIRFAHPRDIHAYIAGVNCANAFDMIPRAEMRVLDEKDVFNEAVMLGLRTSKGVKSGILNGHIPEELKGFFKEADGYTSLTRAGMAVMNSLLVRILKL